MVKEILRMIESVDPADTAKMDEIDARVWCFVHDVKLLEHPREVIHTPSEPPEPMSWLFTYEDGTGQKRYGRTLEYSRSRDILKTIRPGGFRVYQVHKAEMPDKWVFVLSDVPHHFLTGIADTEELAELHAILQAIEYERSA